jgi:hypothetical protein
MSGPNRPVGRLTAGDVDDAEKKSIMIDPDTSIAKNVANARGQQTQELDKSISR